LASLFKGLRTTGWPRHPNDIGPPPYRYTAMLMSELDRVHGHFRRYHKGDLEAKLRAVPADIVHCSYFDAFGTLSWFVVNTVLRRTDFNPTLIHINDRYLVPLSRAVERLITPPFGKNLIVIAQKASDDHKIF
jgi:hypothetical protein